MGVYISDLEIPQEGRITLQIDSNGGVYVVNKFSIISEKYEKSMTATGIQPHGRLGDLDELTKYKYENIWTNRLIIDADDLDDAPTVIEAEGSETRWK